MDYCIIREYKSNADIKQDIDGLFNNTKYILKHKEMNGDTAGYTVLLLKIIVLDNDLTQENYTLTLAHELVHLTHFTANERYVSFITFKVLYESENNYFKSVALAYADAQFKHLYQHSYDCSGYIEEYLQYNKIS